MSSDATVYCPLCGDEQYINYTGVMKNDVTKKDENCVWNHCQCRSIFHTNKIDKTYFNDKYKEAWQNSKNVKERFEYTFRNYIGFIEEATYGRKFLDVGFTLPYNILQLKERGWITAGIDLIKNDYITEDFETMKPWDKFDLIYMGHCLESMDKPIEAFNKACSMLDSLGLLFITTPCPELLHSVGIKEFTHFAHPKSNWCLTSKLIFDRLTLINNMEYVFYKRNISKRFPAWNDHHIILQKVK